MHEQAPHTTAQAVYREPAGETKPLALGGPGVSQGVVDVRGRALGRPRAGAPAAAGGAACSRLCCHSQWTPKDDLAALKLHGRCDDVMRLLMAELGLEIPRYDR